MTKLLNAVYEIQNANEKNKLVIFVGAGVSANSKLPTWSDLINKFINELRLENTEEKKFDYLKIAQYMYEHNSELYHKLIKQNIPDNAVPNQLHNLILDIFPRHIITTNYDNLLEKTININSQFYKTISNDKELLNSSVNIDNHYIIKMHGDINQLDEIVLKEDDYLNYSQNRILTETYIKSLLVDHTFLFIGYSLSDNNLKLIINWIDYLSNKEDITRNRHNNYIFQSSDVHDYEKSYWKKKNIQILESSDLPENIISKYSETTIEHSTGKELFAFLNLVKDENSDLEITSLSQVLINRYKHYYDVNYIFPTDLMRVSGIKRYIDYGSEIHILDENIYTKYKEILRDENLNIYWQRAGIHTIYFSDTKDYISIENDDIDYSNEINAMNLLIEFKYEELLSFVDSPNFKENRINYYKSLFFPFSNDTKTYYDELDSKQSNQLSKWQLTLNKYN